MTAERPIDRPAVPLREALSQRELDCALIIQEFDDVLGRSPTLAELSHELDLISRSASHRLVSALRMKGWLTLPAKGGLKRALKLTARVPMPLAMADMRAVTQVALDAIEYLKGFGQFTIARKLAERLQTALGGADRPDVEVIKNPTAQERVR